MSDVIAIGSAVLGALIGAIVSIFVILNKQSKRLGELKTTIDELLDCVKEYELSINQHTNQINTLKEQRVASNGIINDSKELLKEFTKEFHQMGRDLSSMATSIKSIEAKIDDLTEDLKKTSLKIAEHDIEIKNIKNILGDK